MKYIGEGENKEKTKFFKNEKRKKRDRKMFYKKQKCGRDCSALI